MKILALDTSSKYVSIALADGDRIIASIHKQADQRQCEELIPAIDKLLKKAGVKLGDIGYIAFSKGPGSLTSLRIGAATVKGLAFTRKIKIVGVPTLDAIAYNAVGAKGLIVPVVDARRGNVYCSAFTSGAGGLRRRMKYSVMPVAELLGKIKGAAVFIGDGLAVYGDYIRDNFKYAAVFAPKSGWYSRAETISRFGYEMIMKKDFEDTDRFTPLYVYPKDVQVR